MVMWSTTKGSKVQSPTEETGCATAYSLCSKGVTLDAVNVCCIVHDHCFEHSDYDA
nr:unnamed protein product [Meloidogyne enterolobii]